jgi:hypothetical protein
MDGAELDLADRPAPVQTRPFADRIGEVEPLGRCGVSQLAAQWFWNSRECFFERQRGLSRRLRTGTPGEIIERVSSLEPSASRYCTALHRGSSRPDRSNNTRSDWRKVGWSRSPTPEMYNTSTPVRDRPTTSRSVRRASRDTSDARSRHTSGHHGHRRNRDGRPRHGREIRRGPGKSSAVEPATVPSAAASVGETWLADNSRAQQRSCNAQHAPSLPGGGFVIAKILHWRPPVVSSRATGALTSRSALHFSTLEIGCRRQSH